MDAVATSAIAMAVTSVQSVKMIHKCIRSINFIHNCQIARPTDSRILGGEGRSALWNPQIQHSNYHIN